MDPKAYRVNDRIRARQVRVVDETGEQLGILNVQDALAAAQDRGLDLIEVAPNAKPPVCRIMDYGKFRYDARKKAKEAQKKQKQTEVKMVRVRPNTGEHDLHFKMKNARKFLGKGNKVKFTVIFRGPELRHKEIGQNQLRVFIDGCKDIAQVETPPRMEGRRMTMLLEPLPEEQRLQALEAEAEAKAKAEAEAKGEPETKAEPEAEAKPEPAAEAQPE